MFGVMIKRKLREITHHTSMTCDYDHILDLELNI